VLKSGDLQREFGAKHNSESLPTEAQITTVRFEGPNIAIYTKNPKFSLTELTYHLSSLSRSLKKRFIVRTDPSIRIPEDKTREEISKLLPKEIIVSAVFCDEATGEVVLEVNKPEVIDAEMVIRIAQSTGWISHTRLSPHIPSTSISTIHSTLKASARERNNFLQELGKKIFRHPLLVRNTNSNNYL
jgi:predicted metal-dependent RNase